MEASRNRDSPKLQFSKEESARLVLEKKKAKVEKAAKQLEHAERKIRKQRRLVLTQEEMIAENQASPISAPASSEKASAKKKRFGCTSRSIQLNRLPKPSIRRDRLCALPMMRFINRFQKPMKTITLLSMLS